MRRALFRPIPTENHPRYRLFDATGMDKRMSLMTISICKK
jgi:hypothetical protein